MNQQLTALAEELERDQETLQRELEEIDLLLRQASSEVERNEARRVQAQERMGQVERDSSAPPDSITEARVQLLTQTRRATLMQAQLDVLGGKQRALQRYRERVETTLPVVRSVAAVGTEPDSRSRQSRSSVARSRRSCRAPATASNCHSDRQSAGRRAGAFLLPGIRR